MAKWADYLISGAWFAETATSKYISHVMLHVDNDEAGGVGHKRTKDEVIMLLKNNKTVCTIKWNYSDSSWSLGAWIGFESVDGIEYLRSHPDNSIANNLDNSLPMAAFGITI
ncbi:DUF3892 domain-containing protein [Mucilaginibacter sp.]|uniref:DUF3892 domain-containing protein n=1 Tax=Mucilaginibacter sp. TaxID=1882438 RepID=UPI00261686ED|nr:DUF3892 domain-containing protein [Mucilaginibacter sp.]MDB4926326.1 hypothetical protein [Mucilaginibacter sp.]